MAEKTGSHIFLVFHRFLEHFIIWHDKQVKKKSAFKDHILYLDFALLLLGMDYIFCLDLFWTKSKVRSTKMKTTVNAIN